MATNKQCTARLQKEYKTILKEPVPHISAHPVPTNLLEWHFVLEGDKDTDYAGGVYHGKIVFPPQYPFKPPSLSLYTPNGRFATNTKLCLSFTDHHPETWNPMWSVSTILTGLLSFMHDSQPTTGSISSTPEQKRKLAADSLDFNVRNPMFRKLFPDWLEAHAAKQQPQDVTQTAQAQQDVPSTRQQAADSAASTIPSAAPSGKAAAIPTPQDQQPALLAHGTGQAAGAALEAAGSRGSKPQVPLQAGVKAGGWSMGTMLCTLAAVVVIVALVSGPLMHWGSDASGNPHVA